MALQGWLCGVIRSGLAGPIPVPGSARCRADKYIFPFEGEYRRDPLRPLLVFRLRTAAMLYKHWERTTFRQSIAEKLLLEIAHFGIMPDDIISPRRVAKLVRVN
jgi:hypothetical protein